MKDEIIGARRSDAPDQNELLKPMVLREQRDHDGVEGPI
jgi:hypothetical protein